MKYLLIGTVLGSLVTSSHETEEACKGRKAMLLEMKIATECYPDKQYLLGGASHSNNLKLCQWGVVC